MKYGFIGCGNMGSAIAKALAKKTTDIIITDRSGKAMKLAQDLGCHYSNNETVINICERVFLAVKPQMMEDVLKPLQPLLAEKKPLLISMAAGLTVERIQQLAGTSLPVIRIMPNTPVTLGRGMTLYCHNDLVAESVLNDFLQDVSGCGQWDLLDENLIDAAGVVCGCGPAYMYMFMDALANGAAACGVDKEKALFYASEAMIGAAMMVQKTHQSPEALKNAVCSPGGSTLAGVRVLDDAHFAQTIADCVKAAYKRNQELGK